MKNLQYLLFFSFLFSCSTYRQLGWEKQTKTIELSKNELATLEKNAKSLWAERASTEKLVQALGEFEKIHAAQPNDLQTLIFLTRGYYFLADAHIDDIEKKKANFEKAAAFGEKALATNEAFKQKVASGKTIEESLDVLTKKEVPAIYWTAASLGKWAKATGIAAALKYKTRIKALIERVQNLQPDYFFTAVNRYWGGFYALAPGFAGGDMNKSKINFEKSISSSPEYIGTKVLMAEVYWTKVGNKKQFEAMLRDVLNSKFDNHPEIGPENQWEKKKAEKLLKNMDELF
jgi:hypothetical protein